MMRSLSEAQRRVLKQLDAGHQFPAIKFSTGDSLRKLGLAERETLYIVKRVYATDTGEHIQHENYHAPVCWHEWFITPAGRAALEPHHDDL